MTILEIIILAIALAMDCFTVSIACGLAQKKVVRGPMTAMIFLFGIFQGGMTLAGWYGGSLFSNIVRPIDHWIAFALLAYLGGKMVYEAYRPKEDEEECSACKKGLLRTRNLITMAVATSIDALAVGVSFAFLALSSMRLYTACLIIALASSLFTLLGLGIGIFAGKRIKFPVEALGGIILIGIGIKILIEHLSEA
ncbi:manganese efflux pump MntP family protein [Bacteroides sp. OF04-15BH]|jgi:putative Mn2+ efflux pump MntP|uniref:manganese efflux pump MntP n=1 Tax=Bacteroides sp. OF04-15BH TaxID=2292281 RepID=UPI000E48A31A|nr:manganese efflux pump MntP family protein [Bacteroides sp. OF04-15BH]RHP62167.1 manganese efflux pump [Bacteroides sp. OF04-15BH]